MERFRHHLEPFVFGGSRWECHEYSHTFLAGNEAELLIAVAVKRERFLPSLDCTGKRQVQAPGKLCYKEH